jgi:hypothetical protein
MTLFGSLMLYAGRGGLSYPNSLFFAAGACTQAGLNPIDVNLLNTWQQVISPRIRLIVVLDMVLGFDM